MKIKKLELTNYRGARSLTIDFNERLNVFYGVNGAGKSTVLDAVAIMLSWVVSRIRSSKSMGQHIGVTDIANGESVSKVVLSCSVGDQHVFWRLLKRRIGHAAPDEKSNISRLTEYTNEIQERISETSERVNIPIFVYYPVNRAVLDIPLRIRKSHKFNLLAAHDDALTSGANFRVFFEWFREREDLENENRKYEIAFFKPDNYQYPDPHLEAVRNALSRFLPEFRNLGVRRNPLRMEVEKSGERLRVDQLSDGEKCMIALIGDLARRLAIANPVLENPLDGAGIVLIDEIDLHLHPGWQRMVVPKLIEVFPNCQFVISTHSPHIINHFRHDKLFRMKQTQSGVVIEPQQESYGKNIDRVLEDNMGFETTRPDNVRNKLHNVYKTIDEGNLDQAQALIKGLKNEIGDDPELVKAEVLIKRKRIIGK